MSKITYCDIKNLNLCKIFDVYENYKEGLNFKKNKMEFYEYSKFLKHLEYGIIIARVILPEDARIIVKKGKFYTDKIILSDIKSISDLKEWNDPDFCFHAVKQSSFAIYFVKEQTPELCLESVKYNGISLGFIEKQTPELCLIAVQNNGFALQYVKHQTADLCLAAVQEDEIALKYVANQYQHLFKSRSIICC
jgi:hypothetical protein